MAERIVLISMEFLLTLPNSLSNTWVAIPGAKETLWKLGVDFKIPLILILKHVIKLDYWTGCGHTHMLDPIIFGKKNKWTCVIFVCWILNGERNIGGRIGGVSSIFEGNRGRKIKINRGSFEPTWTPPAGHCCWVGGGGTLSNNRIPVIFTCYYSSRLAVVDFLRSGAWAVKGLIVGDSTIPLRSSNGNSSLYERLHLQMVHVPLPCKNLGCLGYITDYTDPVIWGL